METFLYAIIGILWALVSLLVGRYIIGTLLSDRKHFTIGLSAIVVSYLFGLCFLFIIITHL